MITETAEEPEQISEADPEEILPADPDEFPFTERELGQMMQDSFDSQEDFRRLREKVIRELAGFHYPGSKPSDGVQDYRNVLRESLEAMYPDLICSHLQPNVAPATLNLSVEAMIHQIRLEKTADEVDLLQTHAEAILDAWIGPFGVTWCGLRAANDFAAVEGRQFNPGIFAPTIVDFDDYIIDQSCKRRSQAKFESHRSRLRLADALAMTLEPDKPLFDHEVIRDMGLLSKGSPDRGETEDIRAHSGEVYRPGNFIEIWYFAVYSGSRIWTGAVDRLGPGARFAIAPRPWWGPEGGPYHVVSFNKLPANTLPPGCAVGSLALHGAEKRIVAKVVDDIVEAKNVNVVRPGEQDIAEAVKNARNNEYLFGDPTAIASVKSGGALVDLFPALQMMEDLVNKSTNGVSLMSGAKDVSKTATGTANLAARQQARREPMQDESKRFLVGMLKAAAWYSINDPMIKGTVIQRLPGGHRIELIADRSLMDGDFGDFKFSISALTSQPMDPAVKADKFISVLNQIPTLAQLGPQVVTKSLTILGRLLNEPEIDEINPDPSHLLARQALAGQIQPGPGGQPMPTGPQNLQGQQQASMAGPMMPA